MRITRLSLFPFQQEVFDHPARFKIVAAGRRTGKSLFSLCYGIFSLL